MLSPARNAALDRADREGALVPDVPPRPRPVRYLPSHALMEAVLAQAILDLCTLPCDSYAYRDAHWYVFEARDSSAWLFSFGEVCDGLRLHPHAVRRRIRVLMQEADHGRPPAGSPSTRRGRRATLDFSPTPRPAHQPPTPFTRYARRHRA